MAKTPEEMLEALQDGVVNAAVAKRYKQPDGTEVERASPAEVVQAMQQVDAIRRAQSRPLFRPVVLKGGT